MEGSRCFRDRVREVLELLSDPDAQLLYQVRAPGVNVAEELFNQWEDWYGPDDSGFRSQFSLAELHALKEFSRIVDTVADETPQVLPPLQEFMETEAWKLLCTEAQRVLRTIRVERSSD